MSDLKKIRYFGDYELLEEIAHGGMGTVFKARQVTLKRLVALKLISAGMLASQDLVKRFKAEAEAAAGLDHPNIVPLYEVGEQAGQHYFSMAFIDGPTLGQALDRKPMPPRRAAQLVVTVARAVHFAHRHGVLHRDLKPGNILLDAHGEPHLTDFGLAKFLQKDSTLTRTNAVLGTPAYMAPEQAGGEAKAVTTGADIYGLGAVLYEALTGTPPFGGGTSLETIRQVLDQEPRRPSVFSPEVDRDLETICLKCLEKEPARRYGSAEALAEDLGRWLRKEPIRARPATVVTRVAKWMRRKPALASLIVLLHLVGVIGLAGIVWQWRRAEAHGALLDARTTELRRKLYASDMNLAQQALAVNNLGRARELLNRHRPSDRFQIANRKSQFQTDLRGWEWRYLWQQCQSDARFTLCGQSNSVSSLAVSPDGRWLAVGEEEGGQVSVWDLETRREVKRMTTGTGAALVAFSPTEPLLAMVNGRGVSGYFAPNLQSTVSLWSATSQQLVARFPLDGACRRQILFSKDGRSLVTSEHNGGNPIRFRRIPDGRLQTSYSVPHGAGNPGPAWPVAVARDMTVFACGVPGGKLQVVDWASLTNRWRTKTESEVVTLGFSPDGAILASSSGLGYSLIHLWDAKSGREIQRLEGHRGWISALVFWPDGKTLASASGDQTIRLWDLTNLTNVPPPRVLVGHRSEVWSLVLLPDARRLISGSKDGSVCVWDTANFQRGQARVTLPEPVNAWGFTPDSQAILTVSGKGEVARWHGTEFERKETVMTFAANWAARISKDGRLVAAVHGGGPLRVWDVGERTPVWERNFSDPAQPGAPLGFRANGKKLLVLFVNSDRIEEWDFANDQKTASWRCAVNGGAFSPDEQTCLVFRPAGATALRDLANGREIELGLDYKQASDAAFSPDGRILAGASWLGWIKLWDTAAWRELATLPAFLQGAYSVAFSPDSRRLVAGSDGREAIKVWATDGHQELLTLEGEGSVFVAPAFSPDGNILSAVNWDGLLHLWRAPSWEEIEATEKRLAAGP